ncbi:hypothetical protein [Blastococcus capsensis]|uniref:hypothetical protein n=1 Tax=Blastococcus capsensis TaxID=1564163 RepID=UPI002541CE7F|nr:hypothetical protein [Blastococcus capsensis]MDK3258729.1 hypothetical protein [Blastococcus capsensis]
MFRDRPSRTGRALRRKAAPRSHVGGGEWSPPLRRLRNELALITTASTALLWLDNLSEHYRGGFQRKLMYVPIVANPIVAAAGALTVATGGRRGRKAFGLLSAAQTAVAIVGFVEHQRGILKRPGSNTPRDLLFNAWYGPPVAAPLQYLGLGLLGLMASAPQSAAAPVLDRVPVDRLMRAFTALNIPPLWAEIGYLHARGSFQNRAQWLPVVTLPIAGAASVAAAFSDSSTARIAAKAASGWTALLGAAGTGFHLYGLHRRYGGYGRRSALFNWLNGPPAPAPMQILGLGLAGLAAERAGAAR